MQNDRSEAFDNFLNETYAEITICGVTLTPANVLHKCDPIAYRVYATDYEDMQPWGDDN